MSWRSPAKRMRSAGSPAVTAAVASVLISGCGGSSSGHSSTAEARAAARPAHLSGFVLRPSVVEPALVLRNYTGEVVSLSSLRGKAVFVTFVYTHCPDVCPLIVSDLAAAWHQLPASETGRVRILAVTVDPRGDTPAAIRHFLSVRDATGTMDYLLGPLRDMLPVWRRWHIGVNLSGAQVTAGHTSIVYGITASGRLLDVYPANFSPAQIVHDVPLLAAE